MFIVLLCDQEYYSTGYWLPLLDIGYSFFNLLFSNVRSQLINALMLEII